MTPHVDGENNLGAVVTFDFSAYDLPKEYSNTIGSLREALTETIALNGCSVKATCVSGYSPVVRLNIIWQAEGSKNDGISLLIWKKDAYGYSFKVKEKWYVVKDAPYIHDGAEPCNFSSSYPLAVKKMKKVGPSKIYDGIMGLIANRNSWSKQKSFLTLCFIFMESARFHRIANYMTSIIKVHDRDRYEGSDDAEDKILRIHEYWRKFSSALINYANNGEFELKVIDEDLNYLEIKRSFESVLEELAILKLG